MTRILAAIIVSLIAAAAGAEAPTSAISDETASSDQQADKAGPATTAAAGEEEKEFQPPPGFRTKKFGDKVVYCVKDTTVGTRFKTERCYDRHQLKDYLAAQEENKANVDRIRSICSNPAICSPQ